MGSSFVFRDRKGLPAGYVMQGMGVIRCRVGMLTQPAQLALLRAGEAEYRSMPADGQEQTWPDDGRALTGAYLAADGMLLLDTGEAARRAFERARRRTDVTRTAAVRQPAKEEERQQAEAAQQRSKAVLKLEERPDPLLTRSFPQHRWPPPPCWPEARYLDGQWQAPHDHVSG